MAVCPTSRHEEIFGVSLCAGVGGLDLGLHLAEPGYRTVCYVERNSFAAATLVARMADASLAAAPVWDDLRSFDGRAWRGKVHLLSAGYPCQPFTLSGLRRGEDDPRHLWPQVARIVEEIGPEWCFFENVPGHLTLGLQDVARDLQRMGYRVAACVLSAAEVGGSHTRERLFILGHADLQRIGESRLHPDRPERVGVSQRSEPNGQPDGAEEPGSVLDTPVGSADGCRLDGYALPHFPPEPGDIAKWRETLDQRPDLKPSLLRLDHGLASGMDRTAAAGNGVVPLAAARAWIMLREALADTS
ncbi:DNA cytosine methyltransferase [Thalassovita sp.]|uniref:DNA cytosine methyltransferase n=1 Tax=Thalassovita sp. TaxID=1979401 RepID=UPI002B27B9C7|nr:DNA cytosine methyltransferase [Thalassovita sp.]